MIMFYINKCLKILILGFIVYECFYCSKAEGKGVVMCDNFIDLPKDDTKYKKIIEFIKNPQNYIGEVEKADKFLHYKPLKMNINIKITEEDIKDIIDKEINDIKNRTINVKKETGGEGNVKNLGELKFIYIIENDDIIPVRAGTFFFEDYYDTKNDYNRYKKTYIDLWYDKYLKKDVYSFENIKKFWNENKPDYLYCDDFNYPIFLFKKDEKNKQLFEKEEKHKHCSGLS